MPSDPGCCPFGGTSLNLFLLGRQFLVPARTYITTMLNLDIAALGRSLTGRTIIPGDVDYDDARRTFNGLIDRRPRVIARCADHRDAVASIAWARRTGTPIGVRGGGHSVAGLAMVEDGIVIDLSAMRRVDIDPAARIAHVEGGAQWQDLDGAALAHGLAVPGGVYGDTGVAGLTLGGGIGFLMGIGGFSCDNLVGAQVVIADGSTVEAADDPDLLWALRGGGGNFGVVSRLDLALHPVAPMYGGKANVPLEDGAILRRWATLMRGAPDELLPMTWLTWDERGTSVAQLQFAFVGEASRGEQFAIEIVGDAAVVRSAYRACTYMDIQAINPIEPFGTRHYWKSTFVRDLEDDLVTLLVESIARRPAGESGILIEPIHGLARRIGADHAAFSHREARFHVSVMAQWQDPEADAGHVEWCRTVTEHVTAWSMGGLYVNYAMDGETVASDPADRGRAAYPPEVYARLSSVKRRYDPENVLRGNLNIRPGD